MSADEATMIWQSVTQTFMGLRYLPASIYLLQQTFETIATNSWNTPAAIFSNIPELLWNLVQYWSVWVAVGLMIPFDAWMTYDFYQIPMVDKVPGGSEHSVVQRRSAIIFLTTGLMTFAYSSWVLFVDLFHGSLNTKTPKTIAELATAVIGFLTSISYFFTVNTYDHQI